MRRDRLSIAVVAACPLPCPRGTPTRILRLSEALAARGHEVHIVTYHLGASPYEPRFPNLCVHRIANVPGYDKLEPGPSWRKLLWLDVMLVRELRRLLSRTAVDVIHAHHYEGLIVAALARGRLPVPLIYDAHTLLATELPHYASVLPRAFKAWLGGVLDRRLPPRADGVIAVSSDIQRALGPLVPCAERIVTVPNGVELDGFSTVHGTNGGRGAGAASQETIVYAGTLAAYQRIDLLLESFAEVAAKRPGPVLRIISDSSFEPYEQLSAELGIRGRIDLTSAGFDELPRLLADARVAVNPRTDCAGLPQKNLNYMAAAMPIVCFSGSAKQLGDDTALVVRDGDVAAFADAIGYLLDNPGPACVLGARGRRYVEQHRSWESAARATEQFYRAVEAQSQRIGAAT